MMDWQKQRSERDARLDAGSRHASGKLVPPESAKALFEAVIRPGDRVCLEGDNQKQADFLAEVLVGVDRSRIHDLHIVQSGVVLQAHLDLFERGIARKLDFSYSGPQGAAIARALAAGKIELGAIHTYIELFARYFMDLTPHVALIAAVAAVGPYPRSRSSAVARTIAGWSVLPASATSLDSAARAPVRPAAITSA